jgi:GAF domain-containing protein
MAIWYSRKVRLSPQQMESYSIYTSQTAVAIEKAISIEEANQKATEQEVVSSIARALNEALNVEKAFPQVVDGIRRLVHADRISVALSDEKEKRFMISVLYDAANALPPARWYPMDFTTAASDVMQGKVHVTHDLAEEAGSPGEDALYHAGYRSRVNIPLRVGSDVIGALNVASQEVGEFTPDKLPTLLQIADVLAISIANSRSFQEEQKRARELASLYSLSRKLSSLNDVGDVVEASVQAMLDSIEGLSFAKAILLKNQFRFLSPATVSTTPHCVWIDDVTPYPGIARALEGEKECQNISTDDPDLSPAERDLLFTRGGEFVCLLPLKRGNEPLGVIAVESHKNKCSGSELQLAGSISELASMAFRRVLLFREVEEAYLNSVLSLAKAIDAKDSYTSKHSQQLEAMAVAVAVEMGLDRQTIEDLKFGAQLHDVGKIGMPDSILKKPGPLTPEEWSTMHRHPEIGEKILSPLPKLRGAAAIVRHHHERYDGKGYPDGLKGDEIPIGARILAVVDAYSAIVDRRVYKEPRTHEEAIEELKRNAGTQFDPKVVEVFLRIFEANPIVPHVITREELPGDSDR